MVSAALLEKMPAAMKKDVEKLLEELPPGGRTEAWLSSRSGRLGCVQMLAALKLSRKK